MELKKELTLLDVFCITTGSVISAELFLLPGIAYAKAGPAMILAYILATVITIPTVLSAFELVTAMPKTGGIYVFVRKSMGDVPGALAGFCRWFAISFKGTFALIGIGAYIALITNIPSILIALLCGGFFIFINLIGIKYAAKIQTFLVLLLLGTFVLYTIFGFPNIKLERYAPFAPFGIESILSTAGFLFFSYGGLLIVTSLAEEVKRPERDIPLGIFLSLVVVGLFYTLVAFVTVGILESPQLTNSLTSILDGASISMGIVGIIIMTIAALLAFITTAHAGITSAPRYLVAMSRDKILPAPFKNINNKFGTPHVSILFTGMLMFFVILFLNLEILITIASTLLMISFIFVNLAVIFIRERKIKDYQPKFRAPFYPFTQISGTIALGILVITMGLIPILISTLFIVVAFLWYYFCTPQNKNINCF